MNSGAWRATVNGVAKSRTQLNTQGHTGEFERSVAGGGPWLGVRRGVAPIIFISTLQKIPQTSSHLSIYDIHSTTSISQKFQSCPSGWLKRGGWGFGDEATAGSS